MTMRLVECVPNFSEGRDPGKIRQITDAIESVSEVKLLNVEKGVDTNRAVVTFIGTPEAVEEAAFRAIAKAAQVIDMSKHSGAHPRMGATDVCPFVPVQGVTMKDCVELARRLGSRVGSELGVPVYLYEEAATRPERRNLADIRRGEYEALPKKLADAAWKPDFGPARFNPTAGATVIGAREFLIAYNINLNSTDKAHATDIAFALREKGRVARAGNTKPYYSRGTKLFYASGVFPCGSCNEILKTFDSLKAHCRESHKYDLEALLRTNEVDPANLSGKPVYRPGAFNSCKAIGWYVDDYKRAQISINLTDYNITPTHVVLEEARQLATERGLVVTGSEVCGLIPYQALLASGKYYLEKQGRTVGQPQGDVLRTAVSSLGLNDVAPFSIEEKVLGLPHVPDNALVKMTLLDFTDEVSRDTPAPGGGSISALAGSLGAALVSMVANLTHGREGTEAKDPELARIAEQAQALKDKLMAGVDADTNAFNAYMEARRLPQTTPEEKNFRKEKMQDGLKLAVEVPWANAAACFEAMRLAREVAAIGNPNSLTDAAVGAQMGFAGVRGSVWNVLINLKDISDSVFNATMRSKCGELLAKASALSDETVRYVDSRLAEMIS